MRSAALPLIAALGLAACRAAVEAPAPPAPGLQTAVVELREVELTFSTEAMVEAVRQSTVAAQIAGRIVDIRFDVGDRVEKGEVIVRIDERAATQAVAASQAQVDEAQAALANARAQLERSRRLLAQGFVSQAALDGAEAQFRVAESRMKAMLAGAGQAATEKSLAVIVAPYGGVVSARHVQLGEMATPGRPLMTGFDPTTLRIVAAVPATQVAAIQSVRKARIEIPSARRWVEAKSITVVPSADPRTHTTQVRIDLPPDTSGVYPGVFARAHFVVDKAARLMVPREGVLQRSEVTAVYVVREGAVQLRQIRLGTAGDERGVEVLAGLRAGESIALEPVKAGMASIPGR